MFASSLFLHNYCETCERLTENLMRNMHVYSVTMYMLVYVGLGLCLSNVRPSMFESCCAMCVKVSLPFSCVSVYQHPRVHAKPRNYGLNQFRQVSGHLGTVAKSRAGYTWIQEPETL